MLHFKFRSYVMSFSSFSICFLQLFRFMKWNRADYFVVNHIIFCLSMCQSIFCISYFPAVWLNLISVFEEDNTSEFKVEMPVRSSQLNIKLPAKLLNKKERKIQNKLFNRVDLIWLSNTYWDQLIPKNALAMLKFQFEVCSDFDFLISH